jgi:eukaryotic-like serine/threonine-protein kinase
VTPERWAQIEELFHRAAECEPPRRTALLDEACANDSELRQQVEALLSSDKNAHTNMQAVIRSEFDAAAFSLTGETVSHYRILGGLGGGGMGLVYRAEDVKLGRRVAVKFLPEDSTKDPAALRRFEREARSASALEHPGICPIYEFGEHRGQPFMVMPLLEGQTIEAFVREQGLPTQRQQLQKLLDIGIQVVKGLESAHDHGIIHRDIKPSNIFLTTDGQAKILDFGVAKLAQAEPEERNDPHAVGVAETAATVNLGGLTLSQTGAVVGTAAYMSPEQVRGERVDARTDVFSFGLVLYELATGKRAFSGNTWPVLQEAVLRGTPKPARELNPAIPLKLQSIINRAIEKDRETRFHTAKEMRAELDNLQRELAPRHLPRAWAMALTAAAIGLIGVLLFVLTRPPKTISVAPEIKLRQLTTNSSENPVRGGAISPDGRYLAYIDTRGLQLKAVDTGEIRMVALPAESNNQREKWELGAWFPDSTRLLMNLHPATEDWNEWNSASADIWAISVLSGKVMKIRDHALLGSISPDGSTVSFAANRGKRGEREIWLMGPNGEQPRKFHEVGEDNAICCLGWSPDGKRYGYILTNSSGDNMLSQDVNGGLPVTILNSSALKNMDDMVWLHGGRVVFSLHETGNSNVCNYWTMRLDLATGKRIDEPRRLTNWPNFCANSGSSTSDDKKLAFLATSTFYTAYIGEIGPGGTRLGNLKHFTLEDADDVISDWTADGKEVIVVQNRGDHYSLYKQGVDSETPEPIVSSVAGGVANFATTTPDSKWIIALIWPASEGKVLEHPNVPLPIVRIPLAGGTPETILQASRPSPVSCARPPSSLCVIVEQSEDRKQMIVSALDAVKGRGAELARFDLARDIDLFTDNLVCTLSPDGNRLALARSPESPLEIYSLRGQLIQRVPSNTLGKVFGVVWAPDQKGFFLTRKAEDGNELLHLDLKGHLQSLRKCVGWACFGSPSPDGRHIAIFDNNRNMNMWMMENF